MAENEVEVLTRDKALPQNILPTGRKVGAIPVRGSSMFTIGYVDNKAGKIPEEYQGKYTGLQQAEKDVQRFVREFWDVSDNARQKKPLSNSNAVSR